MKIIMATPPTPLYLMESNINGVFQPIAFIIAYHFNIKDIIGIILNA